MIIILYLYTINFELIISVLIPLILIVSAGLHIRIDYFGVKLCLYISGELNIILMLL